MAAAVRLAAITTALTLLLVVWSCSPSAAGKKHPSTAASAAAPIAAPTPSPTGPVRPAATAVASPKGLARVGQGLVFAGALSGSVGQAEVKQCGVYGSQWVLQMSNMALGGTALSMSLYVDSYTRPGPYTPRGSLMQIKNRQSSFYSLAAGTIRLQTAVAGTVDLTFQGPGSLRVSGRWACA